MDNSEPPPVVELELQVATDFAPLPTQADFHRWVQAALDGRGAGELTIRLVDEAEGRQLNGDFRGRDYATNVLSFPFEAPPGMQADILGDLAICAPVVAREAAEQDKPVAAHWAHMVVHGVLHLLGYDHQDDAEAEQMEALERDIMAAMGFADPYA